MLGFDKLHAFAGLVYKREFKENITSGLPAIRPERTKIKSGSYNFGSTNNVESAFPARVWEEMHQNVA